MESLTTTGKAGSPTIGPLEAVAHFSSGGIASASGVDCPAKVALEYTSRSRNIDLTDITLQSHIIIIPTVAGYTSLACVMYAIECNHSVTVCSL